MTRIALFPGVFDPLTLGHLDMIKRAPLICEKLIIAVADNRSKTATFTIEERLSMLRAVTHSVPYVEITAFSGLAVDYAKERKVQFLLRGLRSIADFEHESQMAAINCGISGLETVFFMARHSHISSSLIREIAYFGGPLADLVPPDVESIIRNKFQINKKH